MAKATGKRLHEITLEARSAAYQWLRRNHADIKAVFAAHGKPPWKALVETAAEEGVVFTTDALRKTWPRLERDLAREAEGISDKPQSQPVPTKTARDSAPKSFSPDPGPLVQPALPDPENDEDDILFRPVTTR